ncbi:hypothetical protein F5Y14DRAFT_362308 [Nemania sp. NC0429]|nr:hypothetical protein F5Y14DRAFT_362308 [Nemania sp. NC0429]
MMSTCTQPPASLEQLPDELLLQILKFSMHHEGQFYPEYCVHLFNESRRFRRLSRPGNQQRPHLQDWCMVNATSRSIRRVGKEVFFSCKTIAMSFDFPQRLRNGEFPAFGTPAEQQLALRLMRSINIVNMMATYPSTILQLPETLQVFPKLKHAMLSFGYSVYDQNMSFLSWILGVDDVWLVLRLLHEAGVPEKVVLQMGIHESLPRSEFLEFLELDVCPRLRDEVDRMKKAQSRK